MSSLARSPVAGLSRRSFLAATSAAGFALLVTGCTSEPEEQDEPVTAAQVDSLAEQVTLQEQVVAAYAAAVAADATLTDRLAPLAAQADEQLARLTAAAPDGGTSSAPPSAAPAVGPDALAWLRAQVIGAADSHAAACLEQSGGRAALLGSVSAGLRGHATWLA